MVHKDATTRFEVGNAYRLATSPSIPALKAGSLRVIRELKPLDKTLRTRTLLCDIDLDGGPTVSTALVFVEEGYAEVSSNGFSRLVVTEIATCRVLDGYIKSYAVDAIPVLGGRG